MFKFHFIQIFSIVYIILVYVCMEYAGEEQDRKKVKIINLVEEFHSLYKDAFENEKTYVTRRLFAPDGNTQYTLHVQKLREVDGVKTHNLRVVTKSKDEEPIIYINNPVEARMPNPFLSIEEFKKVMFDRAENQKKEFMNKRNPPIYHKNVFKENFHSKIFNVQEHVKREVEVKHKAENLKKTIHKRNHKVNKKRKPKNRSRATKAHKKTTISISNEPYELVTTESGKETVTETVTSEELTTESTTGKEIATVTVEDTITKTTGEEEITMATLSDKDTTTEMSPTEEMTTETSPTEKMATESSPTKEITTENVVDEEVVTENVPDTTTEATTTTTVDTTTETTVTSKRTRQARPFVFMEN